MRTRNLDIGADAFESSLSREELDKLCGVLTHRVDSELKSVGARLLNSLGSDSVGQAHKSIGQDAESDERERLRLRFFFSEEQWRLTALPLELLYDSSSNTCLGRCCLTPISRSLTGTPALPQLLIRPPLQVLTVSPSPKLDKLAPLEFQEEWRGIRSILRDQGAADVYHTDPPTFDRLIQLLEDNPDIHVLQFIGHGYLIKATGEGGLEFEQEDGSHDRISGEMLAEHLRCLPSLRLVVLVACYGGMVGADPFRGVAAALLKAGIPAVVAMQHGLSIAVAKDFNDHLYLRLASGDPIDVAVARARRRIYRTSPETWDWAVPAVYMQVPDGELKIQGPVPYRCGIRSILGWDARMEDRVDKKPLDLTKHFDDRQIKHEDRWRNAIYPELKDYLVGPELEDKTLILEMPAHCSIAYAAGYLLEAKSGREAVLRQRGSHRTTYWRRNEGPCEPLWNEKVEELGTEGEDMAVAVSLTKSVQRDVMSYVENTGLSVGQIWEFSLSGKPSQDSVQGGAHAYKLAEDLITRLEAWQNEHPGGDFHLFIAAPNAFPFFLGQLSRGLRRVRLYEYAFDRNKVGGYSPSLSFPPERPDVDGKAEKGDGFG